MERNDIILENDENVRVEGFEIFMQWIWQNSLVLGLNGLLTLFLGIVVITFMAWLILGLTLFSILSLPQVTRQFANDYDYGIGAGYQMMAIGLHLIPIGLFTLILISKILNIILTSIIILRPIDQSRLDFNRSQLIFDLIKIIIFAIINIIVFTVFSISYYY